MSEEELSHGELDAAAISFHEIFMAYVRAGFTRREALELVQTHIMTAAGNSE